MELYTQPVMVGWTNPTKRVIKFDLMLEDGRKTLVVVNPGQSIQLPSQFTRAIHEYRAGVIVGGSAPALVRDGQTETIHSALDFENESQTLVSKQLADEVAKEQLILEEAARIAAKRKVK